MSVEDRMFSPCAWRLRYNPGKNMGVYAGEETV